MKNFLIFLLVIALLVGGYLLFFDQAEEIPEEEVTADRYFVLVEDGQEMTVASSARVELVNGVEESVLISLLEGPTAEEEEEGFTTSIPVGTELISLEIDEGTAIADFTAELDPGGGSAWIMSITEQITETLMQFDTVEEVVILVEGEEDALQP